MSSGVGRNSVPGRDISMCQGPVVRNLLTAQPSLGAEGRLVKLESMDSKAAGVGSREHLKARVLMALGGTGILF